MDARVTTFGLAMLVLLLALAFVRGLMSRLLARRAGDDGSQRGAIWRSASVLCLSVALLIATTMQLGYAFPATKDHRGSTAAFHRAIMAGLEHYRSNYGEYPEPANPDIVAIVDGQVYNVAGALALYQALSGDGNNYLRTRLPTRLSDGVVNEAEASRAFWLEMPKAAYRKTAVGYVLVDGFGHPIQYTPAGSDTVNPNYDLWSFAESEPTREVSQDIKRGTAAERQWIKNW
jgi:hypothetical protein